MPYTIQRVLSALFKLLAGLKSAILAIIQRGAGWPCPVSTALENPLLDLKKNGLDSYELLAILEGKVKKGSFFLGSIW